MKADSDLGNRRAVMLAVCYRTYRPRVLTIGTR